jgi:type I restriction enzyme S subunit
MINERDELPEGWEVMTLADVCEPITQVDPGKTPKRRFTYVDISSVDNTEYEIIEIKNYTGEDAPSRARKPIKTGDVLFATVRPYLRNIAAVPRELDGQIASTGFCVLRAKPRVDPRYLFRYVLNDEFIQRVTELQRGISYPAVTDRDVYSLLITLPPLDEQHRIVAKIEQLFAESRTAREALDGVPALIKRFRQAVLAKAFRGELTERDPSDEPASVLLERIRAERRVKSKGVKSKREVEPEPPDISGLPELPEGWEWTRFEELLTELKNGYFSKTPDLEPPGIPILRISAVRPRSVTLDSPRYLRVDMKEVTNYQLRDGDLLFTRYNGTLELVGVCGVVRALQVPMIYPDKLIRTRVFTQAVLPEYLELYFTTKIPRGIIENKAKSSAGQQGISGKDLRNVPVALASLAEQRRIVAKIEALFAQADAIEAAVQVARQQADAKRVDQAILARAFRGEL